MKNNNVFYGDYVQTVVDVCTAAAVSGQHAIIIGLPGAGKTTISKTALDKLTNGRYLFKRINPSTPVEEIMGAYDPAALLNTGEMKRVMDNTPYNPHIRGFVLDEIARGSEVMFDALLDVLDRQDVTSIYDQAFCLATANFTIEGERANALKDRFALWVYLPNEAVDIDRFCDSYIPGQRPTLAQPLPQWADIEKARAAVPGPNARAAIKNLLKGLEEAAAAQDGFMLGGNNRRLGQWFDLLYRVGVLVSGDPDFAEVPERAAALLRYAWPCQTEAEAGQWAAIVNEIVDLVGTAIEEIMGAAFAKFSQINGASDIEKADMLIPLGEFMVSAQAQLRKIGGKNTKVDAACNTLKDWYQMACRGMVIKR